MTTEIQQKNGPTSIVWRTFIVRKGALCDRVLQPVESDRMTAACAFENHKAPDPDCTCGVYAFYQPAIAWDARPRHDGIQALARCSYSGQTIIAERGIRTEHMLVYRVYIVEAQSMSAKDTNALYERYPDIEFIFVGKDELLTILQG